MKFNIEIRNRERDNSILNLYYKQGNLKKNEKTIIVTLFQLSYNLIDTPKHSISVA